VTAVRLVVQRVARAGVAVCGREIARIGRGLLVLVGVERGDGEKDVAFCTEKIAGLRVFEDEQGKMNLSVQDVGGDLLLVSQFTLLGDVRKGKRPSFSSAEDPAVADALYRSLCDALEARGLVVGRGKFRADMQVELVNDGPVTILLDSRRLF
jgi:D-tyrosyl-tRNA(Tyr) deacylase